jgi:hypothetical protein
VNVEALMVDAVIAWLKVAVTAGMMATPVAALAGVTEVIVGAVGGGGVPEPATDPPHPATRSAAGNRREAILKRMITIYLRFSRTEKIQSGMPGIPRTAHTKSIY